MGARSGLTGPRPAEQTGPAEPTVLGGRYTLTRRVAVGGMGEVWAANDTVLGREVAVKILREQFLDSPLFLARFRAEARHAARLAHPGIASVFDYGEDLGNGRCLAYLVMELVAGVPLSQVLAERGSLPVATAVSFLAQTAEALSAAHLRGVVHRDVKPGNLLVVDNATIKVTDFGIARAVNAAPLTDVGQVVGTARYMSPEQAAGVEAGPASDVYSLAVVGYEMLAGHAPFTADNPAALALAHLQQLPPPLPSSVPAGLRDLLSAALAKNPSARPPDAGTFAAELRRLQSSPVPPPAATAATPPIRPHPATVAALSQSLTSTTRVFDGSQTTVMPARSPVAGAANFVTADRYASRHARRRLLVLAAAFGALVALIVVVRSRDHGSAAANASSTTASTPSTRVTVQQATVAMATIPTVKVTAASVNIDLHAFLGRPVAEATVSLSKAGFIVRTTTVDAPGLPAGIVMSVLPSSGPLPPGATVTLTISDGVTNTTISQINGKGNGKGKGKAKGND